MPGSELDIAQRNAGVESGHDEGRPEHVWMDESESGLLTNGSDPAMGRAPVKALAVVAMKNRALAPLAKHKVDGAGHPRNQGDHCGLVALANNAQRPMPPIKAQVLRVGGTSLADPQPVKAEEHSQRGMVVVVALGGEEKGAELAPVEPSSFARVHLGPSDVLRWVGSDPPVDVSEAVVPADGREPSVDGRRQPIPAPRWPPATVRCAPAWPRGHPARRCHTTRSSCAGHSGMSRGCVPRSERGMPPPPCGPRREDCCGYSSALRRSGSVWSSSSSLSRERQPTTKRRRLPCGHNGLVELVGSPVTECSNCHEPRAGGLFSDDRTCLPLSKMPGRRR